MNLLAVSLAILLAATQPAVHIRAAVAAFQAAEAARSSHDWKLAETSYLRAIDIEPTYMEAYRGLVELYRVTNRPTEAAAILTRILQIEPNSISDRLLLGRFLLDNRQSMRALAQFNAAVQCNTHNADALYWFIRAARESGMADRAFEAAQLGAKKFPKDARFPALIQQYQAERRNGGQ